MQKRNLRVDCSQGWRYLPTMTSEPHEHNLAELTVEGILKDPSASMWLQTALKSALLRDIVDSANDAAVLAAVLEERACLILREAQIELSPIKLSIQTPRID